MPIDVSKKYSGCLLYTSLGGGFLQVFLKGAEGVSAGGGVGVQVKINLHVLSLACLLYTSKLADTLEDAIFRARNVASPKNAVRLKRKTPCAVTGSCQDCKSPDRMCRGMLILWEKMTSCEAEVVLIDEELGY